tara:strand:- start:526 stop:672 length:147 start_codon:yes stop_codon:yes gene_type:complete
MLAVNNREGFNVIKTKFELEEIKVIELDSLPVSRLMDKYLKKETNYLT